MGYSSEELISSIRGVNCSPVKPETKKRNDNIQYQCCYILNWDSCSSPPLIYPECFEKMTCLIPFIHREGDSGSYSPESRPKCK